MQIFLSEIEKQYFEELKEFYSPYFANKEEVDTFINKAIQLDWDDRKPRQMLFHVQRFVNLAAEIDKLLPDRDGLRALFLKCCMDSLAKLSSQDNKKFCKHFSTLFSDEGKQYILANFSLSHVEYIKNETKTKKHFDLTIDDILEIIKSMRDMVVHEGNYWELHIFAYDKINVWLPHIETSRKLLDEATFVRPSNQTITYHFETTLQYEKFIYYFVEACKNFISNYIESKLQEPLA